MARVFVSASGRIGVCVAESESGDRMMRKLELPLLWLGLALPGGLMVWAYMAGHMSYDSFIQWSGDLSVWLLIAALAVTPINNMFGGDLSQWLVKRRRDLGISSFCYALGHLAIYLLAKVEPDLIVEEGMQPGMMAGWIALVVFVPLVLTSNGWAMRLLKKNWKRLHVLVYLATALVLAHWWMTAPDPTLAMVHAIVVGVLMAMRFAPDWTRE